MIVWCNLLTILKQRPALRNAGLVALCAALITTLLFGVSVHAQADVDRTLSFQGRLQTASGAVVPDGHYNLQFKIYKGGDGQTAGNPGGSLQWTETYTNNGGTAGVEVRNGYFSANLGSKNSFGTQVDWNSGNLWLSMNVAGSATNCTTFGTSPCTADGEMLPMRKITATPYSLNSGMLEGKTADQFTQLGQGVQTDDSDNSSIFINKTGSGNLIQLQNMATDVFAVANSGDVVFGSNADHTISVATPTDGSAGKSITLAAGDAASGSGLDGGSLVLAGGQGDGSGQGGNIVLQTDNTDRLVIDGSGNVGIGTATPATQLSLGGSGVANGITFGNGGSGAATLYQSGGFTLATNGNFVFQAGSAQQTQIGFVNGGDAGILFGSAADTSLYRSAANVLKTDGTFLVDGNVGIGTDNPLAQLDVYNSTDAGEAVVRVGAAGSGTGTLKLMEGSNNLDGFSLSYNGEANRFDLIRHDNSVGGVAVLSVPRNSSNVGIGITNPAYALDVAGSINVSGQYLTNGADIAENYTSDQQLEAGDVVAFTGSTDVAKAERSSQANLAGIVSTSPGMTLGHDSGNVPLALNGRVPTKVSNENGAIKPGDMITASSQPGVGMKATEPGRVVGMALEGYSGNGTGKITVFVNPHSWVPPMALPGIAWGGSQSGDTSQPASTQVSGSVPAGQLSGNTVPESNRTDKDTANVQAGSGSDEDTTTSVTLDRVTTAPSITSENALLGSMYYDTTKGELQCYEADGWGGCSARPDTYVTISPEYKGAVMNGNDIGTITSDLCSDMLGVNDGSSGQPTVCGTDETYNFYGWTSGETTDQTRSIYVNYQLPEDFKEFVPDSLSLMGRTDSADAKVAYQVYRYHKGEPLASCGSAVTVSTGAKSTWQKETASGSADPANCNFTAGDSALIRINLTAKNDANAYVSNLDFVFRSE